MKAIRFHEHGGPEVLRLEQLDIPQPAPGEVLIKVAAAGVNFTDIRIRRNDNGLQVPLPYIPGKEIAGEVVSFGRDVTGIKEGMRVRL